MIVFSKILIGHFTMSSIVCVALFLASVVFKLRENEDRQKYFLKIGIKSFIYFLVANLILVGVYQYQLKQM